MHRSLVRLTLALILLGAMTPSCDRKQAPEAKTEAKVAETSPTAEAGGCDTAHGKTLEQELLAQCAVTPQVLELDVPPLPWKAAPSAMPDDALRIDVGPQGLKLGGWGDPVSFTELPARFAGERERVIEMAVANGRPRPADWVLSIEANTTRLGVAVVLQTLVDAGLPSGQLRLATDPTEPLPVPRDPKLLAELATKLNTAEPGQKAMLFADELQKVMPACPAAEKAFSVAATDDPAERCAMLARDLSKALVGCGCAKELEIMTLLYAISVSPEPPTRLGTSVTVMLDPTAEPLPGETWSQVVANLDEAKLAKLWVGPA